MSILLNSIDCPRLTVDCLALLTDQYSIRTTNDFVLWLIKSDGRHLSISSDTIECIQSCLIAHTAALQAREPISWTGYRLNHPFFDQENLLRSHRHLIFIYQSFNQNQWNLFFNFFLLRLFHGNPSVTIQYLNTNSSLFDLHSFYSQYCSDGELLARRNDWFEKFFYFNRCLTLESLEEEVTLLEMNDNGIRILIIDDLLSLLQPYFNLDRRIKSKVLQLTYRLNRLAQKRSLLIINGLISHTKNLSDNSIAFLDRRFDSFHADKYLMLQPLSTTEANLHLRILKEKPSNPFKLDLKHWTTIEHGDFLEISKEIHLTSKPCPFSISSF